MTYVLQRFKYRLDSLLKLWGAQRDGLKRDVQNAMAELDGKLGERNEIDQKIKWAEEELRELSRGGGQLPVDDYLRYQTYLRDLRARHQAKQAEVERAAQTADKVQSELKTKAMDTKALERHKGRKRSEFLQRTDRAVALSDDDGWLHRSRRQ